MHFFVFLACFRAYVGQPDNHIIIGWATSMPFASIYPTNPRTNWWNFHKKNIENWQNWKTQFFWVGHFEFIFSHKFFFCFIPIKISRIFLGSKDGSKFWWLPWFPAISLLCVILRYTVYVFFERSLKFFLAHPVKRRQKVCITYLQYKLPFSHFLQHCCKSKN